MLKNTTASLPRDGVNTTAFHSEGHVNRYFKKQILTLTKLYQYFFWKYQLKINRNLYYIWNNIIITEDLKQLSFDIFKGHER